MVADVSQSTATKCIALDYGGREPIHYARVINGCYCRNDRRGGGLGNVVLQGITQLDVGKGFVGGLSVVILAIILDRVTQSFGQLTRNQTLRIVKLRRLTKQQGVHPGGAQAGKNKITQRNQKPERGAQIQGAAKYLPDHQQIPSEQNDNPPAID